MNFSGQKRVADELDRDAVASEDGDGGVDGPRPEGAVPEVQDISSDDDGETGAAGGGARSSAPAAAPPARPRRGLHLRGVSFLLTWSQCDRPLKEIADLIQRRFGDVFCGIRVASEKHADGTFHRHAFLVLKERTFVASAADRFDLPRFDPPGVQSGVYKGNYKVAAAPAAALDYVSKGGDFVDMGKVAVPRSAGHKSTGKTAAVVGRLLDGATSDVILSEFPEFYFMQRKRIEEFASILSLKKELKTVEKFSLEAVRTVQDSRDWPADIGAVLYWIGSNICSTRAFKQKQLFLYGPPNVGKTSLIQALSRFVPVYFAPTVESYFDHFDESYHRLVAFDEFKGQHQATFMNQFLEMGVMTCKRKGSQFLRRRNVPVILSSNFPVEECYPNAHALVSAAFRARVQTVEIVTPLFGLIKELLAAHGLESDVDAEELPL